MRKKLIVLLTFVLALTVCLAVVAGCAGKGAVEISKERLEVITGKTGTLTAVASNGSEIEWLSSDEAIATVDGGKVTGVKAGTATITAKATKGKGQATCEVTVKDPVVFTFKDEEGDVVTKITVDRNKPPVQITATASDGSKITGWSSSDEKILKVENGLITPLYDGEATVNVATSTGSGSVKVTVIDTFQGEKYDIGDTESATQWYYWVEHPEVTEILKNEVRGSVTFGFEGGNWNSNSIKLMCKQEKWEALLYFTATIEADFEGTININGTRVAIREGENKITVKYVYYQYFPYACYIEFGTAKDGTVDRGTVTITDMNWFNAEEEQLKTPSFTLNGDEIVITDENEEMGVEEYKVGLFANADDEKPVFIQILSEKTGVLDASKLEEKGEYYVKVMAVGNPGYTDSAWSEAAENKYEVNNESVEYFIPEGGGSAALASSSWYYFIVDGGSVLDGEDAPYYDNGTLTFKSGYLGWAFYSTELLRHYPTFENGSELLISMKINASHAGTITVSDTVVELVEGNNDVYVKITQKSTACTITVMFGRWLPNTDDKGEVNFPLDTELTFVFTDVSVTDYVATNLKAVSGTVDAESKKINVQDENEAGVKGYELGFFKNGTLMKSVAVNGDGTFSDEILNDGIYELRIRAVATDVRYIAADWTVIDAEYEVKNGGATYDVAFGGDSDNPNALSDLNTWYYWNDQNWTGSSVTINEAKTAKGVLTIDYTVNSGACDHGVQIYYKDPSVSGDTQLTFRIETQKAINVTVNGAALALKEGINNLTVYYTQGGSYSFSMQVKVNAEEVTENVLKISEVAYAPYTYKTLSAPEIAVSGDGTISITDGNESVNVGGYVLGYFTEGAANPLARIEVKNGDTLDYSMVDSGEYTLKIMAVAADNKGYRNSAWNAGVPYTVVNEAGAHYDLDTLFGGADATSNPGRWGVWADRGWTGSWVDVTEATYANNEINITFTADGKSAYGLQINYVNPAYAEGTKYTFDIVATEDMDIQVENGGAAVTHLKAGEKVSLTGGADSSFYIQVNINGNMGGTITISNIKWN